MRIIGDGLIARSLGPFEDRHQDVVAFASGVSDSTSTSLRAFQRECSLLYEVLEQARQRHLRVVYFSGGGAIYGRWTTPAVEAGPLEPRSAYGRHQLLCEAIVRSAGVRYLIARLPNVVGPGGSRWQLIPALVRQVLDGRVQVQAGASRDLIDVEDMARVLSDLLQLRRARDIVNVASGSSVPVPRIVDEIARILSVEPEVVSRRRGEAQRFSTNHLSELLGCQPFEGRGDHRAILSRYVPGLAAEMAEEVERLRRGSRVVGLSSV